MSRPRNLDTGSLRLDRRRRTPLYRQLYERIREAIANGVLRPGDRLPSTRSLASQVAAARGTVDLAYNLLSSEGYIESRGAAGTFVAARLTGLGSAVAAPRRPAFERSRPSAARDDDTAVAPFRMGLPALDAFPRKLWSRLAVRRARTLPIQAMLAPNTPGYRPLREAIASYVTVSRGVSCAADQVIVTSGFQGALGLIARTLLEASDSVWFEDPGYFVARRALEACGAKLVPVPVDAEGMNVPAGVAAAPRSRLAYVTPSHQAPLGVALSLPRRLELLAWAAEAEAFVIEDDYDSEFRYGGRPLPALKSLDGANRVLYVGSFSKVLFPGLRLGYVVAPESVLGRLVSVFQTLYCDRQLFDQAITADFIAEGHFARHLKRMRALYAERRAALASALERVFDGRLNIELGEGGMHLLVRSAEFTNDEALVARARSRGLVPAPLSIWGIECVEQGLLLSFTNIPAESSLRAARRLKRVLAS